MSVAMHSAGGVSVLASTAELANGASAYFSSPGDTPPSSLGLSTSSSSSTSSSYEPRAAGVRALVALPPVQATRPSASPNANAATASGITSGGASNGAAARGALVGPLAIFTPCSNSHTFEERRVPITRDEEHAVKIGRAVARFQPAVNNAIFDCKVLSRNHAIMWFEHESFFIKDTRSSNGTFVNNCRLSNNGEESPPRALRSGDILQLGVEIVDNTKNVASGCITCIVRLVDERGEECVSGVDEDAQANRLPNAYVERIPSDSTLVKNEKLFVMSQYMREAIFREKLLTDKLRSLEEVLSTTKEAAERGWQAVINEERLLSRIEMLENQVHCYRAVATGTSEEQSERLQRMLEDQTSAETALRESSKNHQQQVYESSVKLRDTEFALQNQDKENGWLRERCETLESALKHEREAREMLLNTQRVEGAEAATTAGNGGASTAVLAEANGASQAQDTSAANAPQERSETSDLNASVVLEACPFVEEGDSSSHAADDECATEAAASERKSPNASAAAAPLNSPTANVSAAAAAPSAPPVYLTEAEVQTEPLVERSSHEAALGGSETDADNERASTSVVATPPHAADCLFLSLYPFAIVFALVFLLPLRLISSYTFSAQKTSTPPLPPPPSTEAAAAKAPAVDAEKLKKAK